MHWNNLFLRDTYTPRVGMAMMVRRVIRYCIFSCLVSIVYMNYVVQDSLEYNTDIDTMWYYTMFSCTLSQSARMLCCVCALFWYWVPLCVLMIWSNNKVMVLQLRTSLCVLLLDIIFDYWIEYVTLLHSDSFLPCQDSLLRNSTWEVRGFTTDCPYGVLMPWIFHLPPETLVWNGRGL